MSEGKRLASTKGAREDKELRTSPQRCTACVSSDPAVTYCQQCSEYLCSDCKTSHQRQHRTKDHSLIDVKTSDSMRANANIHCPLHGGEMLSRFCLTCNDIACQMCVTTNHKTHKVTHIAECEDKVFNLCLDKMKTLQGPFVKIKAEKNNMTKCRKDFSYTCDTIEKEIIQRKTALVSMITNIAEETVHSVRSTKKEFDSLYSQTETQLDKVLEDCKTVTTPLAMGTDINNIVKRILFITAETQEANSALSTVNLLEKNAIVKLEGNNHFSEIETKTKKYFGVQFPDLPAVNLHKVAMTRPTFNHTPLVTPSTSGSSAAPMHPDTHMKLPNKLEFVSKAQTHETHYLSKHVCPESFVANAGQSRTVYRLSYTVDGKVDRVSQYTPESLENFGRSILTIRKDRHVIIAKDDIHLCDNTNVIRSVAHSADGYIPDIIGFYNQQKFVTVCKKRKKLRYHDVNTLDVINTYSLGEEGFAADLDENVTVLSTSTGDIILETGDKKLTKFSAEGAMKKAYAIHSEYYDCDGDSICIDKHNTIFGVQDEDKSSIHAFSLQGEHNILENVQMSASWKAGLDDNNQLYFSYSRVAGEYYIAKYKY